MRDQQIIPLVDLKAQYGKIRNEIDEAVLRCIEQASFIKGKDHAAFSEEFAEFCGGGHVALCGNGTDALYLALHELLGPGDGTGEIITVAHTFIATAEAILRAGYKPVFVDIDQDSFLMDVEAVEKAVTPKTKGIIPVHLYGRMVAMDALMSIADKHDLVVIEDAAQAHGATYKGKGPGQWGTAACFSFFPGKNLGAFGDGGCTFTEDAPLAERLRSFSDHGRESKYLHDRYGVNSRLDGIQAAVLRVKLRYLDEWSTRRADVAAHYTRLLSDFDEIVTPVTCPDSRHVYHLYVIKVADGLSRDDLLEDLKAQGVMAGVHYPIPLHLQPALSYLGPFPSLPVTEDVAGRIISLPVFPEMSEQQVERVVSVLADLLTARND